MQISLGQTNGLPPPPLSASRRHVQDVSVIPVQLGEEILTQHHETRPGRRGGMGGRGQQKKPIMGGRWIVSWFPKSTLTAVHAETDLPPPPRLTQLFLPNGKNRNLDDSRAQITVRAANNRRAASVVSTSWRGRGCGGGGGNSVTCLWG